MSGGPESKKQLGKILLQQKLVSAEALQEMLEEQKRDPTARLASVAARSGRLSMQDALRALAEQHAVPGVDLTEEVIPLAMLRLIPIEIAYERCVFPLRLEGEHLWLAMSSPDDNSLIEELEFVTAKKIARCVALDGVLRRVARYSYEALERGDEYYVGAHVTESQLAALGLPDMRRAPEPLSAYPAAMDLSMLAPAPQGDPPAELPPEPISGVLDAAFGTRMSPSQAPEMAAPDPALRVLIAIERDDVRRDLADAFAEAGVSVLEAGQGVRALELLRDEQPRVLVIDVGLRAVQGLDVCRRVRASQSFAQLPIVALADGRGGWRMAHDLRESFGIEHVFEPPIDAGALTRTVRMLLAGRSPSDRPAALLPQAEEHWSAGMSAFERGDMEAAITALEAAAAIDSDAFELQYHLGLLYGRRDDLFGAVAALEKAARLQTRHFAAVKNLAVVCQRAGLRHKALDAWERAMELAPDEETRTNIKQHVVSLL
jgi:CheY-like chemotaxis protein